MHETHTFSTEEHFAIGTAVLFSVLDLDGRQALLDGSTALVGGEDTLAGSADFAL